MKIDVNRVVVTGNLTRDPDRRSTPSGTPVCHLRVAVNGRRRNDAGEWVARPNYFDVTVWGARGESCAAHLHKGRSVAIDGRLAWREWEASDGSGRRQAVEIVADQVQFLGSGRASADGGESGSETTAGPTDELAGSPIGDDDELPF